MLKGEGEPIEVVEDQEGDVWGTGGDVGGGGRA